MKRTEFDIKISAQNVCAFLDADKTEELYEEIMEELKEMLPEAYRRIRPVALLEFGTLDDFSVEGDDGSLVTEALFGVCSIGKEMEEWSSELFAKGDYLGGMLADAIADDYLFQMDDAMQETVLSMCREKKKGIIRRVEAPQDIPMSIQKRAYDVTDAQEAGISIKKSYMYDPVKTVCQVYLLDDNTKRYHPEHDCSHCGNLTCKRRSLPTALIRVRKDGEELKVYGKKKDSLLQTLREHNIFLSAVCGGRGTCGKCAVQFTEGAPEPSAEDMRFFSGEEIDAGYRLACTAYPEHSCTVQIREREQEEFFVLADRSEEICGADEMKGKSGDSAYGIAVDIGTTTLAMQLVELSEGKIIDVYTDINRQRAYGADVISRIEASNSGKGDALRKSILDDLLRGIQMLTEHGTLRVKHIVIGANSTMVHLLMGYSCETLGVYPFTPVNIDTIRTSFAGMFGKTDIDLSGLQDTVVTVCPGISTYVGGDIVAGMYALELDKKEKPCVLIDLGTNGEMAVGCGERFMCASTAAGPAFEGGNIVCGTGSIPGAVCGVELVQDRVKTKTIGDKKPAGICGTGVIEAVYELKKADIIDETGLMDDPYFEEGFLLSEEGDIRLYQKDVREIQLAKSAVRAGLETLLLRYGVSYQDIEKIYIAGGFGYKMDIGKASDIGLLPAECRDKIEAAGNTCLKGAVKYLLDKYASERTEKIKTHSEEIQLSNDRQFQEYYMEYMYF